MCTAATYQTKDFYFGRTLDYEFSYGDEIVVTPRRFPLDFCHMGKCDAHYGMIGMAHVADGYPLYYDAVNEKGVGMAGLNFVGNAVYQKVEEGRENVAQYELIPWVLGQCANLQEVRKLLAKMNLVGTPFGDFPAAQLHWIIADASGAITLECTKDGLQVYDNPAGVLTNNPPFPMQMFQLLPRLKMQKVLQTSGAQIFRSDSVYKLQQGNGCDGASGRSLFGVEICARGVCEMQFRFRGF